MLRPRRRRKPKAGQEQGGKRAEVSAKLHTLTLQQKHRYCAGSRVSVVGQFGYMDRISVSSNVLISDYSIFDSALYRSRAAKWLFLSPDPYEQVVVHGVEVKATLHTAAMFTCEAKMLKPGITG